MCNKTERASKLNSFGATKINKKMKYAMDVIDRTELLTKFNMSLRTLQNWEKRGLPKYSVSRKIFYKVSEVEAFIIGEGRCSTTKKYGLK